MVRGCGGNLSSAGGSQGMRFSIIGSAAAGDADRSNCEAVGGGKVFPILFFISMVLISTHLGGVSKIYWKLGVWRGVSAKKRTAKRRPQYM